MTVLMQPEPYQKLLDVLTPAAQKRLETAYQDAARLMSPTGLETYLDGAMALFKLGRAQGLVETYLEVMPQVAHECGEDIVGDCINAAMKLSSMTSGTVVGLLFTHLPSVSRHLGDAELLRGYLSFIHQFASTAARGLRPMLNNIDELLSKLTLSGLRRWANFGAQAYRRDFNNLTAYFDLASADSRAVLQKERRGVLFVAVQRKLNFYLRALWGRDFFLRPSGADHINFRPYIEQRVLHMPDAVDDLDGIPGLELYRASAAHMAAHLMYGCAISAEQLSPAQRFFIALVEDARIEYKAGQAFPGLKKLWTQLLAQRDERTAEHPAMSELAHTALMLLDATVTCADVQLAQLCARFHADIALRQNDPSFCWHLGMELFNIFARRKNVPSLRILERINLSYRDDNRLVWSDDARNFDSADGYTPERARQVRKNVSVMEMANEVDCELAGADAQEIWTCSSTMRPYEDDLSDEQVSFNDLWGKAPICEPYYYPEWDYQVQLHRPDWTTLYERAQPKGDPDEIHAMIQQHKPVVNRIKQIIDLLAPMGVQRQRGLEDGDEIDINAAVDAMVAQRMGEPPNPRITLRNVRKSRDLAVLVLLDLSESTNDVMPGSDKTVLQLTREACTLMAMAIEGVGDPYAIHGFASDGRHDVQYYRLKDFNQRFDDEAKARLSGMRGGLSTRMGAALRHAGQHLRRQPDTRKLVLLVTDGAPADIDVRDPQHLRLDAKKAVEALHTDGVRCYCLTLDPNADDYVKRIFGANHYTVVDHVDRLPEALPLLFANLTR